MPKLDTHRQHLDGWLAEEINKSKAEAWSRDQSEKYDRLLVDRNLTKNFGVARTLHTRLRETVKAGQEARAKNDAPGVQAAQKTLSETFLALEKLVAEYLAARKDIGEATLKDAKNYANIDKALKGMQQMLTDAEAAVKKGF